MLVPMLVPVLMPVLASVFVGCRPEPSYPPPPAAPTVVPASAPAPVVAQPRPEPPTSSGVYVPPLVAPVAPGGALADVAGLVERLRPTVVNITTTQAAHDPHEGLPFFMRPPGGRGERRASSLGTGFIVDPGGLVVTNSHVVAGADDIVVRLSDERELPARIVGRDPKLDLALLRVDGASNLSAAVLGDSDGLKVGDWVIAIGNPYGLGHTVTLGITSAKDRTIGAGPYDAFIQTDASINPGNSGGPLFNLKGEVVGIPTAIRQGAQGIGFAVPVNALKDVLPQLRDRGAVSRGKLGVRIQRVTADLARALGVDRARGALVANLEAGGAAARAGVAAGDVITQVDGAEVPRSEDLPRMVARHQPGTQIKITLVRGGKPRVVDVVLDPLVEEPEDGDETSPPPRKQGGASPTTGRLGVQVDDAPGGGARVRVVAPTSPASGQLAPGDVIVEVNRQAVGSAAELMQRTGNTVAGQTLLMKVRRGNDQRFVALTVK